MGRPYPSLGNYLDNLRGLNPRVPENSAGMLTTGFLHSGVTSVLMLQVFKCLPSALTAVLWQYHPLRYRELPANRR